MCKCISRSGLSIAFFFIPILPQQQPDCSQDTMFHSHPALEKHHVPLPYSWMVQTSGKAASGIDAITHYEGWHTRSLQAWHGSGSCYAPPTMWHLHQCNQPTTPFIWLLPRTRTPPHTLNFCFAPRVIPWVLGTHKSFHQLRTGDLITHCHGHWHSSTPQLFSTAPLQPTELSKGLFHMPSCSQSTPLPALSSLLSPSLSALPHTSESHSLPPWCWPILHIRTSLCKSLSHCLNVILNFPFNL